MTAPEPLFDTLIYTDCRQGQGLRGTVGLQFQARSTGADQAAMTVVQRHLLYEPPAKWMRERRPVEEYPPSFAHTWDGHLATGAGVYLGKEVNGSREGNQLTHSVVTRDPYAYQMVRPAMLFRAPFWTDRPAPTTQCPRLDAGWQPGPFDAEAAKAFVMAQPEGVSTLIALLSALQRVGTSAAQRVLFLAEDPEPVLRWIATATLLMPQEKALHIGFKVFTSNPAYASQPVVAVHPGWDSSPVRLNNDLGYAVFDLVNGGHSAVEATASARRWVEMLWEHDPIDVVDTIELGAASGLTDEDESLIGRVVLLGEPLDERSAWTLVEWLRNTSPDLLAAERGPLVDALADGVDEWSLRILSAFDEVSRSGQVPADRMAPVRLALITAEVRRAQAHAEVTPAVLRPLPPGVWQDDHQLVAEWSVTKALRDTTPAGFDAVLQVAHRFSLAVRIREIRDAAYEFVLDWAAHPEREYEVGAWPCRDELDDMLSDVLCGWIEQDPKQAPVIGDHWWKALLPRFPAIPNALDRAVLGAAILHLNENDRRRWVTRLLNSVPPGSASTQELPAVTDWLWSRATPTLAELRELLPLVAPNVPLKPQLFLRLARDLAAEEPDREEIALGRRFVELGAYQPDAETAVLLTGDEILDRVVGRLKNAENEKVAGADLATQLRRVPERLLLLRRDDIASVVLLVPTPRVVVSVLEALPAQVWLHCVLGLRDALRKEGRLIHLRVVFYLSRRKNMSENNRRALNNGLIRWINAASAKRLNDAAESIAELGAAYDKAWRNLVKDCRGGNPISRAARRRGR